LGKLDLHTGVEYIKGVGPNRAELLQQELGIFTIEDLLQSYPFRYVDKTEITLIKDIKEDGQYVQCVLEIIRIEKVKGKRQSRLSVMCKDASGFLELIWFKGVGWILKYLKEGAQYLAYGKVSIYKGKKTIVHPELERLENKDQVKQKVSLSPIYSSTEKLNARKLDSKAQSKIIAQALASLKDGAIKETLPEYLRKKIRLEDKLSALRNIHKPKNSDLLEQAKKRLKFEEIFYMQLRLLYNKELRKKKFISFPFAEVGNFFNTFYKENLGFELTGAQKRVLKEIRRDLSLPTQMIRLLQGDVGSGKTIVAVMSMLLALDNGYQACLMAPTEILAQQHFSGISELCTGLGIRIAFLSGSVKGKKRNEILKLLKQGEIHILIGTHALIEPSVEFKKLGIAIIDEQHRFGVMQRYRLWKKNIDHPPHILVMTATPIPRTLALTLYGDLDVSVIDEMPPGRKEIKTIHRRETHRAQVIEFMHKEIEKGRQIYIVFPLIEESEKLDLNNLMSGYDELRIYFPAPKFKISVVHGKMKAEDKEMEMRRFAANKAQIMVATTVIEVGVNVPNASVMIIENTERFGLSQLHQLRGRVGRGAEQSYCILMTGTKLSKEGRKRVQTMVDTNDGFKIAEVDLNMRGPGNIEGTQQSGTIQFNLFNIVADNAMVAPTRNIAIKVLESDPELNHPENKILKEELLRQLKRHEDLGRVS